MEVQHVSRASHPSRKTLRLFLDAAPDHPELSPSARCLWVVLWSLSHPQTGVAEASLRRLAACVGLQERRVRGLVRELVDGGFLEQVGRTIEECGGITFAYRIHAISTA